MTKLKKILIITLIIFLTSIPIVVNAQVDWIEIQKPYTGMVADIDISFSNPDIIYVVFEDGSNNYLFSTTDNGSNWNELTQPPNANNYSDIELYVNPANSLNIYSLAKGTSLYKSTDNGETWIEVETHHDLYHSFKNLRFSREGIIYGIDDFNLYKSIDNGESWTNIYSSGNIYIEDVACARDNNSTFYLAVGDQILKSTDNGENFNVVYDSNAGLLDIDPTNSNICYSRTSENVVVTEDGFNTYTELAHFVIYDIDNSGNLYTITDNGVEISMDHGSSWNRISYSTTFQFDQLQVNPDDNQILWAGFQYSDNCDPIGLLKSNDGGQNWQNNFGLEYTDIDYFYSSVIEEKLYVSTYEGTYVLTNNLLSYRLFYPKHHDYFLQGILNPDIVYMFEANYYKHSPPLISMDNGITWSELSSPNPDLYLQYTISKNSPNILYSWERDDYRLYKSEDYGETWEQLSLPEGDIGFAKIAGGTNETIFIEDNNNIYKSIDFGQNWDVVTFPSSVTSTPSGPYIPNNTTSIQYYFGYCGIDFSVFISYDNSESFTVYEPVTPNDGYIDEVKIDPTNPETLINVSYDGLWLSRDSGIHWTAFNSPLGAGNDIYGVYFHPSNSDILIAKTEGGIFYADLSVIESNFINPGIHVPKYSSIIDNYPNPFNNRTKIQYQINQTGQYKFNLYRIDGRFVKTIKFKKLNPGIYNLNLNMENQSSGIYFLTLLKDDLKLDTKKITLIK